MKVLSYTKAKSSKILARLLELPEVQRLHLRLMELASFNQFDGKKVVKDLLVNKELWQACIMDREGYSDANKVNTLKSSLSLDLIKLRDMGDFTSKTFKDQIWNVDTIFIFASADPAKQKKLYEVAKSWGADEVDWIKYPELGYLMGGATKKDRVLRVWWD